MGCSLSNISGSIKFIDSDNPELWKGLPRNFRIGYEICIKPHEKRGKFTPLSITQNFEYFAVLNANKEYFKRPGHKAYGLGLEIGTYEFFFSRIGYRIREGIKYADSRLCNGITYGAGIRLPVYHFTDKYPISVIYDFGTIPWDTESMYKSANSITIHSFQIKYELR